MNNMVEIKHQSDATTLNQNSPIALMLQAVAQGASLEQVEKMMELQERWSIQEARKAYVADMAAFKLNPPEIYKTKLVSFSGTEYMHATIGDVAKAIVDALARHGFSHSWETRQADGMITVNCKITHRMGHSESTSMQSAPDVSGKKNSIQAIASAVSYLSRYTLLAACGLATMDIPDDDGRGYEAPPSQYQPAVALQTWIDRANAAIDIEALRVVRGLAAEEFKTAKDVASWNAFKAYTANLKSKMEGAQA